jgi:hypothetical protein
MRSREAGLPLQPGMDKDQVSLSFLNVHYLIWQILNDVSIQKKCLLQILKLSYTSIWGCSFARQLRVHEAANKK